MNLLNGFVGNNTDASTVKYVSTDKENKFGLFTKATCVAVAFSNDMKQIHLHAAGEDFDKIHDLAESLYKRASDECDYLAEMSMEYGEEVPNFSDAVTVVSWTPCRNTNYSYGMATQVMVVQLSAYIKTLQELREASGISPDVQSKLDDMIRDWNVELQYKLERRTKNITD